MRKPEEPTQKEFEDHMISHMPFRAWCPHCVKGRAKSEPHPVKKEKAEEVIPVISMDYMWMKSAEDKHDN